MKEQLQERLIASLDKIQEYIEATEEFVSEQAPLIAQEIIYLGRIESTWTVAGLGLVCIVAAVIAHVLIKRALRIFNKEVKPGPLAEKDEEGTPTMIAGVISAIVSIITFAFCIGSISGLFEPWFAPRVYLIHEIGKML